MTAPGDWPTVLSALLAAQATLVNPSPPPDTTDPYDFNTASALATALSSAGAAWTTATTVTTQSARIYSGVAPDGSAVVSFSELPTPPTLVTPATLFAACVDLIVTLCGISGTIFDNPIPPYPELTFPVVGTAGVTMPDMGFALGWAQVAQQAYLALGSPPGPAVTFYSGTFVPLVASAAKWATFLRTFPVPVYLPGALDASTTTRAEPETTVTIPPARIYNGVAPDGSSIVSFSEIPSMPLQVTPDELFKAGKYLMTLCGVTGTMFDHPMPPCPTVSIPITNGQTIVQPDTSFALGWAYVARDAYLNTVSPSALAVAFWGTLGDPTATPPVPPSGFLPMMAEAAVWANYIRSFPMPVYFPGTLVAETTIVTTNSLPVDDTTLLALLTAIANAESFTAYLLLS